MDEARLKQFEKKLLTHDRRHDDSDRRHEQTEARMAAHETLIGALQKSTAVQERLIEVGEGIILALGWAAKAAKWTLTMAAFFTAVYQIGKAFWIKLGG